MIEDRISKLENRTIEFTQCKQERENRPDLWNKISNIRVIGVSEGKEKLSGAERAIGKNHG